MRQFLNIIREMYEAPRFAYHGSSAERWTTDQSNPDGLYVTIESDVAANYASEWQQEGEQPIIVKIDLAAFSESTLGPNAETAQQYAEGLWGDLGKHADELTWRDTLRLNGTFVIFGFKEQHKASTQITRL